MAPQPTMRTRADILLKLLPCSLVGRVWTQSLGRCQPDGSRRRVRRGGRRRERAHRSRGFACNSQEPSNRSVIDLTGQWCRGLLRMALIEQKQDHPGLPEDKNAPPLAEVPQGERTDERTRAPAREGDKPAGEKPSRLATMRRHPWATAAVVIAIIAVLAAALIWWLNARHYESTDDAFIDARTVQISPQVGGVIVDVPVTDNQPVTAGSPLVHIDPRDYQVAVAQAQ